MRIKIADLNLLVEIYKFLNVECSRKDLSAALLVVIDRLDEQLETERLMNKKRAATNRQNGYRWKSSYHPKKSKYINEMENKPLMELLLEAGYSAEEMHHHETDLYVYVTPLTTKIIEAWCKAHGYTMEWHCPIFIDQITGRKMYDCAFQYIREETIG